MNNKARTASFAAAFLLYGLPPGLLRGQQPINPDKSTKRPAPTKALSPEDAEIQRLQEERKRLLKQKEIEKLRKENAELENGPDKSATVQTTLPIKAVGPEDAELQRLEEERKRLLKEQEIEKLRKQNDALKTPPLPPAPPPAPSAQAQKPPSNCTPQQGPMVRPQVPVKASAWACKTLGICSDNKQTASAADTGCPSSAK